MAGEGLNGWKCRGGRGRSGGGRLTAQGQTASLRLSAHDAGAGAALVDHSPHRGGDVGEETGDEVGRIESLGILAAVAVAGQVRGAP